MMDAKLLRDGPSSKQETVLSFLGIEVVALVCFGFADPYHTGQALAGLAVLYPFVPGEIRVIPDFERRVCRGRAQADGRLYAVHFVFAAFQVLRRRAVRQTYRDIRDLFQAEA